MLAVHNFDASAFIKGHCLIVNESFTYQSSKHRLILLTLLKVLSQMKIIDIRLYDGEREFCTNQIILMIIVMIMMKWNFVLTRSAMMTK